MDGHPILVVEDDELVRSFLCRALANVAGEVDPCATGAEAARAVSWRQYSVILLDGLLPDIHGVELARTLVEGDRARHTGICFVSGSLRQAQPMRAGISALPKPLRVRELVDAVQALLEWRRSPAEDRASRLAAIDVLSADLLVG